MSYKAQLIIVSAPSGAGKSTLCSKVLTEFPQLVDTITYTTRSMRDGESEGNPYHFVKENQFLKLRDEGFFIEWAVVHGKYYGTPKHQLEDAWKVGKWIIMDVDVQGADTFRRLYPEAVAIFILPPSIDELRKRIIARDKGKTPDLELRLKNAEKEIQRSSGFDYQVINDNFDESYKKFREIIQKTIEGPPKKG